MFCSFLHKAKGSQLSQISIRQIIVLAGLCISFGALEARAEGDFTWTNSLFVVSDDRLRGVSLSDTNPALQFDSTIEHASGLYGGVFGSLPIGAADNGELDFTAGYFREIKSWAIDIAITRYTYPAFNDGDFTELSANVSWNHSGLELTASIEHAPPQEHLDESADYLTIEIAKELVPEKWRASVSLGSESGAFTDGSTKTDWTTGISRVFEKGEVFLKYVDTDANDANYNDLSAATLVLGAAISF